VNEFAGQESPRGDFSVWQLMHKTSHCDSLRRPGQRALSMPLRKSLPFLAVTVAILTIGASYWHVHAPYPLEYERFGVGLAESASGILKYDLEALGAGWYLNWGVAMEPPHPNGVAFLQTVRLEDGSPTLSEAYLTTLVQANPGAVWQIGNEPDSIWLDNATPEQYAQAYHELYHIIKAADPTAQVANGGLVQATPIRLLYLERIWEAYQNFYGEEMPVDVWTVHGFILNEERYGWGADIPPGMSDRVDLAVRRDIQDHDDMTIFEEQIVAFRQWMYDHGQREKPLLVNEYGILMPADIGGFGDGRVIAFMYATFEYFRTAKDGGLGYSADGDRLVQAWAWYSLDDDTYSGDRTIGWGYNGDLFTGAYTKTMTALGLAYAGYVTQTVGIGPAYTDLAPLKLQADLTGATWGQTATITLTAEVANHGRQPADAVEVRFWDGDPDAGGTLIGAPETIPQVPGRYEGTGVVSVTWTTLVSGTHDIWIDVDPPPGTVSESDEGNNRQAFQVNLEGDLLPDLYFTPPIPLLEGDAVTVTLTAEVTNAGPAGVPEGAEVQFWMGEAGQEVLVASQELGSLTAGAAVELSTALSFTVPGLYRLTVEVDPADVIVEAREENNSAEGLLLVATARVYLPVVLRSATP